MELSEDFYGAAYTLLTVSPHRWLLWELTHAPNRNRFMCELWNVEDVWQLLHFGLQHLVLGASHIGDLHRQHHCYFTFTLLILNMTEPVASCRYTSVVFRLSLSSLFDICTSEGSKLWNVKKVQCFLSSNHIDDTYENPQRRKAKSLQPVWLCIHWRGQFKETFENAQWRKVKQMQPVWLCISWCK